MKLFTSLALLLPLAACATGTPVPHVKAPPPRWTEPAGANTTNPSSRPDADASDRFLREEIERKGRLAPLPPRYEVPPDTRQSYEPETKRFLDGEIDRKTPPPEPEVRYVYVDRSVSYGHTYEYDRPYYSHYGYRGHRSTFPWYTAWGAGLGAVIGHQHHRHAGRGAWIGGGIGLLLDIGRWHR